MMCRRGVKNYGVATYLPADVLVRTGRGPWFALPCDLVVPSLSFFPFGGLRCGLAKRGLSPIL